MRFGVKRFPAFGRWLLSLLLCAFLLIVSDSSLSFAVISPYDCLQELPLTYGRLAVYSPGPGESRLTIARRFGVSLRALSRANSPNSEPLLIPSLYFPPPGEPGEVVLNLAERVAYLYGEEGEPIAAYPMAIGQPGWETPTGTFTIINQRKNPTWFPPAWAKLEKPVPPGPKNPLGDRWMGLSEPGLGLHATNAPASIGRAVSHGCIRLYPEHAQALYEQVNLGTQVRIIYETMLLGYSPADRAVYLAVHPDIYGHGTNSMERANALLRSAGLEGFADDAQIQQIIESARGVPVPLLGSNLKLKVNGVEASFPFGPTPRGDDYLVPAMPLAQALNASIMAQSTGEWYIMRHGDRWLAFSPGERDAWANSRPFSLSSEAVVLRSRPNGDNMAPMLFVPLKAVCLALGVSCELDESSSTLSLSDPSILLEESFGLGHQQRMLESGRCTPPLDSGCASPSLDILSLLH